MMDRDRWEGYKQRVKKSFIGRSSRFVVEGIQLKMRLPLFISAVMICAITHHLFRVLFAGYLIYFLPCVVGILYDSIRSHLLHRELKKTMINLDVGETHLLVELYPLLVGIPKLSSMLTDIISKRLSSERETRFEWSQDAKSVVVDVLLTATNLYTSMDRTERLRFSMKVLPQLICQGNLTLSDTERSAIMDTYGDETKHSTKKLTNKLRNYLLSGKWKSSDNPGSTNPENGWSHVLPPHPVFQKRKGKFFLFYLCLSLLAGGTLCATHQLLYMILGSLIFFLSFMLILFAGLILSISFCRRRDSLNAYMHQALSAQTESLPSLLETCILSGEGFQIRSVRELALPRGWQSTFKLPKGLTGDAYWCLLWMLYQIDAPLHTSLTNSKLAFLHRVVSARSFSPEFVLPVGKEVNGATSFSWIGLSDLTIRALGYLGNKSTLPVLMNVMRSSDNLDSVKMAQDSIDRITLRLAQKNNDLLTPSEMDSTELLMPRDIPYSSDLRVPLQSASNLEVREKSMKVGELK